MDDRSVQDLLDQLEVSWNRHDMKSFSAVFTEDAYFVNVGGTVFVGRAEIESRHAEKHVLQFKESRLMIQRTASRFLGSDVAVVQGKTRIEGDRNTDGTSRTPRDTVFTAVALRRADGWKLVAFHNTNKTVA